MGNLRDNIAAEQIGYKANFDDGLENGLHDDQLVLEKLLERNAGETIAVPPGTYTLTRTVTMPANTKLKGGTWVVSPPAGEEVETVFDINGVDNVDLERIEIHGQYNDGIRLINANNCTVKKCHLTGGSSEAIRMDAVKRCEILYNHIASGDENANSTAGQRFRIGIWGATGGQEDCIIKGNRVVKQKGGGIALNNSLRCFILYNYVEDIEGATGTQPDGPSDSDGYGLQVYNFHTGLPDRENVIIGNRVINCWGYGCYVQSSNEVIIRDNFFDDCMNNFVEDGVLVTACIGLIPTVTGADPLGDAEHYSSIIGNVILNSGSHGIAFFARTICCKDNFIISPRRYGILARGARDCDLSQNYFKGCDEEVAFTSADEFDCTVEGNTSDKGLVPNVLNGLTLIDNYNQFRLAEGFSSPITKILGGKVGGIYQITFDYQLTLSHLDLTVPIPMRFRGGADKTTDSNGEVITFLRSGVLKDPDNVGVDVAGGGYVEQANLKDGSTGTSATFTFTTASKIYIGHEQTFQSLVIKLGASQNDNEVLLSARLSSGSAGWINATVERDWTQSRDGLNAYQRDSLGQTRGIFTISVPEDDTWGTELAASAPDNTTAGKYWMELTVDGTMDPVEIQWIKVETAEMMEIGSSVADQNLTGPIVITGTSSTHVLKVGDGTRIASIFVDTSRVWIGSFSAHDCYLFSGNQTQQVRLLQSDRTTQFDTTYHTGSFPTITVDAGPSPNTATMDLSTNNHQFINLALADENVTVTVTEPSTASSGVTQGTIKVLQNGAATHNITWVAGSGISNVVDLTGVAISTVAANKRAIIDWTFDGTDLYLTQIAVET